MAHHNRRAPGTKRKLIATNINLKRFFMARPIGTTLALEGEDAIAVLKEMQEAPTQEDKEFAKEIRNQRIVLFSK